MTTVRSCGEGYICGALSRQQLATNFGSALGVGVGDIGVCAYAPNVRACVCVWWWWWW